jgi:hypothetical protein
MVVDKNTARDYGDAEMTFRFLNGKENYHPNHCMPVRELEES